jgi:hypothetical protein
MDASYEGAGCGGERLPEDVFLTASVHILLISRASPGRESSKERNPLPVERWIRNDEITTSRGVRRNQLPMRERPGGALDSRDCTSLVLGVSAGKTGRNRRRVVLEGESCSSYSVKSTDFSSPER